MDALDKDGDGKVSAKDLLYNGMSDIDCDMKSGCFDTVYNFIMDIGVVSDGLLDMNAIAKIYNFLEEVRYK